MVNPVLGKEFRRLSKKGESFVKMLAVYALMLPVMYLIIIGSAENQAGSFIFIAKLFLFGVIVAGIVTYFMARKREQMDSELRWLAKNHAVVLGHITSKEWSRSREISFADSCSIKYKFWVNDNEEYTGEAYFNKWNAPKNIKVGGEIYIVYNPAYPKIHYVLKDSPQHYKWIDYKEIKGRGALT